MNLFALLKRVKYGLLLTGIISQKQTLNLQILKSWKNRTWDPLCERGQNISYFCSFALLSREGCSG